MKNYIKLLGIIALTAVIVFSMAACKKSSAPAAPASSSSNNVDQLLADYEKFVDDYAALMQRITAGDATAVTDAQNFEAQVKEWTEKWEGISENDFTPAQALKMQELTTKFVSSLGL